MSTELTIGSRFNKRARSRPLRRLAPTLRLGDSPALLLLLAAEMIRRGHFYLLVKRHFV